MKRLLSLLLFSITVDLCWSECEVANWWTSFDREGWSTCKRTDQFITGFYRGPNRVGDHLYLLEMVKCCEADAPYQSRSTHCHSQVDWGKTLDTNYQWAKCPEGYFLNGLYRSSGLWLYNIEMAKCCKHSGVPYGDCKEKDIPYFNVEGWESCDDGYYMAGFYKSNCNQLHCIDTLKCCKMFGGTLSASTNTISSPNYPGAYPPKMDIIWSFDVARYDSAARVVLNFEDFELENDTGCDFDALTIYYAESPSGMAEASHKAKTLCGDKVSRNYELSAADLKIWFKSDGSVQKKGFRLSYHVKGSDSRITEMTGAITSRYFPKEYPSSHTFTWSFGLSGAAHVKIDFREFELEDSYDKVEIFNSGYLHVLQSFTGHAPTNDEETFLADGLKIRFTSDSSVQRKGFLLKYEALENACAETLSAYKGTITSPNYPNDYDAYSYCTWSFNLGGVRVRIEFSDFELEDTYQCKHDALMIYDYHEKKTLCGNSLPENYEGSSAGLKIRFTSGYKMTFLGDGTVKKHGFRLTYQVPCDKTLRSSSGIITSPNYPSDYPAKADCEWSFDLNNKQAFVKMTISDFQLEKTHDKVKIYLFSSSSTPMELSGEHDTFILAIPAATTRIHFKSDGSVQKKGFKIEYQTISG